MEHKRGPFEGERRQVNYFVGKTFFSNQRFLPQIPILVLVHYFKILTYFKINLQPPKNHAFVSIWCMQVPTNRSGNRGRGRALIVINSPLPPLRSVTIVKAQSKYFLK